MREPDIGRAGSDQVVGKNGVDVAGDFRHAGVIDSESGENPIGIRLPRPAFLAGGE